MVAQRGSKMESIEQVRVWDRFVRIFHWGLAASVLTAWLVEDHDITIHSWAGYTAVTLVALRIVWGFTGSEHARFSDFVRSPGEALRYARAVVRGDARRHLGHNPAGGLMVIALLFSVIAVGLTGMATLAVEEAAGPMAGLLAGVGHDAGEWIGEIHELLANATILLAGLHVAGVLVESLRHRENLVRAMFTGRKALRTVHEDAASHESNRGVSL